MLFKLQANQSRKLLLKNLKWLDISIYHIYGIFSIELSSSFDSQRICITLSWKMSQHWKSQSFGKVKKVITSIPRKEDIRQGDPISLLLFVLYIENLSHLILEAVGNGTWNCKKVVKRAPKLSHLMFAYNLFIYGHAILNQMVVIKSIMNNFMTRRVTELAMTNLTFYCQEMAIGSTLALGLGFIKDKTPSFDSKTTIFIRILQVITTLVECHIWVTYRFHCITDQHGSHARSTCRRCQTCSTNSPVWI